MKNKNLISFVMRVFLYLLVFCLVACSSVSSQATPDIDTSSFIFEFGVGIGDTIEDVQARFGSYGIRYVMNEVTSADQKKNNTRGFSISFQRDITPTEVGFQFYDGHLRQVRVGELMSLVDAYEFKNRIAADYGTWTVLDSEKENELQFGIVVGPHLVIRLGMVIMGKDIAVMCEFYDKSIRDIVGVL